MTDELQILIDVVDYAAHWANNEDDKRKLQALSSALAECDEKFEELYLGKLKEEL